MFYVMYFHFETYHFLTEKNSGGWTMLVKGDTDYHVPVTKVDQDMATG